MVEAEEAWDQLELSATDVNQGVAVLKIPQPRRLRQSKTTLGKLRQIISAAHAKGFLQDLRRYTRKGS